MRCYRWVHLGSDIWDCLGSSILASPLKKRSGGNRRARRHFNATMAFQVIGSNNYEYLLCSPIEERERERGRKKDGDKRMTKEWGIPVQLIGRKEKPSRFPFVPLVISSSSVHRDSRPTLPPHVSAKNPGPRWSLGLGRPCGSQYITSDIIYWCPKN